MKFAARTIPWVCCVLICCQFENKPAQVKSHWAYQPLDPVPIPATANRSWPRNPIDSFILKGLEDRGWQPSLEADKRTLLRRVYFDLIGLPPTPEETKAFLADSSARAYETVVDRLLDSPRYGERWARHWMDAVHFAETHGHDQDRIRTNAWPYRDYLIHSFNEDKPYGRSVQEQVAGDVLFPDDPQATVALGMIAAGPWDESSLRDIREDTIDRQIGRYLDRDDMVSTVMQTFTSTTVQCARCHDHKFDPIPQSDYYALQAVFAGVDRANRIYDSDPAMHQRRQALLGELRRIKNHDPAVLSSAEAERKVAEWESANLYSVALPLPQPIEKIVALAKSRRNAEQQLELAAFMLQSQVKSELTKLPQPSLVYAAASDFQPDGGLKPSGQPRPVHILKRGDINKPLELAIPGTLSCVPGLSPRFNVADERDEASRRVALAEWLSARNNPLTWRSIVNRTWLAHFGKGLVETPNDFGRLGAAPSHPELLDWLARWFRDEAQGSLKGLHRLIVTSAAYRQSSTAASGTSSAHSARALKDSAAEIDADNRFLWRMNRTRLDADQVRDTVLQISGNLDLRMGGPSDMQFDLKPGPHVTPKVDYALFNVDSAAARRRSVYRFLFRTLPDPLMDALDCPAGDQLTPLRNSSVTVQQALAMWNSAFVTHYAARFAERLASRRSLEHQIQFAVALCFQREPTSDEFREFSAYVTNHGLANLCRVLLNSNEFMFVN